VVLVSDLRGVRKGLGHAAAAIGREGAGCLDGVLEWLEGLELGGSSGRARCRQPQERDRRAAAASARGSSGRRGNGVEPRRPARAATAAGAGQRQSARAAARRRACGLPPARSRDGGGEVQLSSISCTTVARASLVSESDACGDGLVGEDDAP